MRLKELVDYLNDNAVIVPQCKRKKTLIVIGDSKGRRLQNIVKNHDPENTIVWRCKGGRTSLQAAEFVKSNLGYFVQCYGEIIIAIWTGTCDLTQFIQQKSKSSDKPNFRRKRCIDLSTVSVSDIIGHYRVILSAAEKYGSKVKVVFLECPQYSIAIWNQNQGHPDFESFKENTEILLANIKNLNKAICQLNAINGISAPKFSVDLCKSRKSNQAYKSTKVQYSLLQDGIHPGETLSCYWLRRIVIAIMIKHCYA